ncbi:MAG: SsgA family sporulation/cell division regulator [Marmoricola sp.]
MNERPPESPAGAISLSIPLISGESGTAHLGGELHFDAHEPYAVTLRVRTAARSVDWVFSRELLADGLLRPSGSGDVQVWPCHNVRGDAVAVIELHAPTGKALLRTPAPAVQEFVNEIFAAVPLGTECIHLDIDAVVEKLLS